MNKALLALALMAGLLFSLNPAQALTIGADGVSPPPEVKSEKGLRVAFNPITEIGFPQDALHLGTDKGSLQGIRMKAASSPVHAAPLPGAILLMTAGLLRLVAYARRRRLDEIKPQ
jgi:hypothetical protein